MQIGGSELVSSLCQKAVYITGWYGTIYFHLRRKQMFKVLRTYDGIADQGCPVVYTGSYEGCRNWIRNLPDPKYNEFTEGKFELDILDTRSQRLVSYVI
jgi:hypothetical protein